jgi:hypothetical protein
MLADRAQRSFAHLSGRARSEGSHSQAQGNVMRTLVILLAVIASTGCSLQRTTLRPSQVNDSLHDLDADAQNPFNRDPNRVQYVQVGAAEYDGFFKDAAEITGTVVLSNALVSETNGLLAGPKAEASATSPKVGSSSAGLSSAVQLQTPLTADQKAQLNLRAERLQVLSQILANLPARSADLVASGQKLKSSAKDRFGVFTLTQVKDRLDDALDQLQRAENQAPGLAAQAQQSHVTLMAMLSDKAPTNAVTSGGSDSHSTTVGKGKKKATTASKKKKPNQG